MVDVIKGVNGIRCVVTYQNTGTIDATFDLDVELKDSRNNSIWTGYVLNTVTAGNLQAAVVDIPMATVSQFPELVLDIFANIFNQGRSILLATGQKLGAITIRPQSVDLAASIIDISVVATN